MKKYTKYALSQIKEHGYKLTDARQEVVETLAGFDKPVSPYDIQRAIKSERGLNHVTIYRILEMLMELHLVHKVANGGFIKCSIPEADGCHHFLICDDCGDTQEFIDDDGCHLHLPSNLKNKFHIKSHTYEIAGLCNTCFKK
jgi:Fe2+ or Zn2+ uptake regulation protein